MDGLIVISAFLLTAGLVYITNRLALISWRRSRDKHWSEQARLCYPVRKAAGSNAIFLPVNWMLLVYVLWPDSSPLWAFTGAASAMGAFLGTLPLEREIFPRINPRELLGLATVTYLLRFGFWFVFIAGTVFMPDDFGWGTLAVTGLVVVLWWAWSQGGSWIGRKLGLLTPPPERVQKIVSATSAKMNVPVREVMFMPLPFAQAFAFPARKKLLFTSRLMELMPDDEVAAVCAHELAHLTETRRARGSRYTGYLIFFPWLYFNPLIHLTQGLAFFGLCLFTAIVPALSRRISRRLESRADGIAKANEGDAGTYARALLRLYEDGLLPTVLAKGRATHPDLYDRMLAAGVTPDFPRPAAAASMSWHGHVVAGLTGIMAVAFLARYTQHFGGNDFYPNLP